MLSPLSDTIQEVMKLSWPTVFISVAIIVSLRLTYLYKNHLRFVFYQELFMLSFILYILCLFQVVTFQDVVNWSSNNFVPFQEILRYDIGSRLFFRNVLGNMILFLPYGFFASFYLKLKKVSSVFFLTLIASVSIETMQLAIGRVFDVDDIILNLLGGIIGFGIYYILDKIGHKLPNAFHKEWLLNLLAFLFLVGTILLIF